MKVCCVTGCPSKNLAKEKSISFFQFPADLEKRETWFAAVSPYVADISALRNKGVPFVCELHFPAENIVVGKKKKLYNATPCVFFEEWTNLQCPTCAFETYDSKQFEEHSSDPENCNANWHKCRFCSYKSNNIDSLLKHQRLHVKCYKNKGKAAIAVLPQIRYDPNEPEVTIIEDDDETFEAIYDSSLVIQTRTSNVRKSGGRMHHCQYCSYQSKWSNNVRKHERIHEKYFKKGNNVVIPPDVPQQQEQNKTIVTFPVVTIIEDDDETKADEDEIPAKLPRVEIIRTNTTEADKPKQILYQCAKCPYKNIQMQALRRHVASKHLRGPQTFKCDICNQNFASKGGFVTHQKSHKKLKIPEKLTEQVIDLTDFEEDSIIKDNDKTICEITNVTTVTEEETEEEPKPITTKTNGLNYDYDLGVICGASNEDEEDPLRLDQETATDTAADDQMFKSQLTVNNQDDGLSVKKDRQLGFYKVLVDSSAGDMNCFKCTECPYETLYRSNFRKHEFTHKAKKNPALNTFKCTECTYVSAFKHNLDIHMRTHNGKDLYKCNFCGYSTVWKNCLKNHVKIKHNINLILV